MVFDGVGEFGEGLGVVVGDEEGIVAEAAVAARGEGDRAGASAFGDVQDLTVRLGDRNGGDETRATIRVACFSEFGEK